MKIGAQMNMIATAVAYAAQLHDGQTRKGAVGIAYTHHLAEVATLVGAFGGIAAAIAAAWLHDAVEDTAATLDDIRARLGDEVAGYVAEVTVACDVLEQPSAQACNIASVAFTVRREGRGHGSPISLREKPVGGY
jgi:(p)ppGpp synthase/HD superfamily hydrolase